MANERRDLYRWKRLTNNRSTSSVTKSKPLPADDIQSWLKKVEQASDEAAAITFGTGRTKERSFQSNGHTGALATIDALKDHDEAYHEAQDLLTQWMAEKCNLDDGDEDDYDIDYLNDGEQNVERPTSHKTDLLSHWEQLLDENDPGMLHQYNGPSSDAFYQDIEDRDDDRTVQQILDGLLEKDMGEGAVKKDLGLNPNKKRKDPRATMAARQQKVKENREKKERERKKMLEERQAHRDAQVKARQMVKQEEKARALQMQQEEMKLQQEMAHIRKELQETKRREEEERRRKRLAEEEARSQMEREELAKKEEEAKRRVEDERRLQMQKDELLRRTAERKAKEEAENLKCKHRHFQAWYHLVVDQRMKMGKARALSDWRCLLRAWNAWRAYHRACQAEKDTIEAELFVKESHRKNQAALKHHREHLLRKYFVAWQIWMSSQEEASRIEEAKVQTRNKMDAFLKAAASGRLWTERSGASSDGLISERKHHHRGTGSSAPSSSRSANSEPDPEPRVIDTSKSPTRTASKGKPSKPKHAWQVSRKHLKLAAEEMAHVGEDQEFKIDQLVRAENLQLNLDSVSGGQGSVQQKKGVPFSGSNFEHRYANQQKMLMDQRKQLDEQRRLIEDLQAAQREQIIKMQIKNIQEGGGTTGVSSGLMGDSHEETDGRRLSESEINSASNLTTERTTSNESVSTASSGLVTGRTTSSAASRKRTASQPALLKGMEERAAIRAQKKAEREEKMRQREEERLALLRAEEERKVAEEEQKKKAEIEKRKEQKQLEKQKELEKRQRLEKISELNARADSHCRLSLMRNYGFKPWRKLINDAQQNWQIATRHHSLVLLREHFMPWHRHTRDTNVEKQTIADAKYREILLQRSLNSWKRYGHYLSIQYQRARRHYVLHLKTIVFKAWQDFITNEKLREWKCEEMAVEHNQRRILARSFKSWKSYPKMLKQEKQREQRREEMRKKVSSLLPDFGLS